MRLLACHFECSWRRLQIEEHNPLLVRVLLSSFQPHAAAALVRKQTTRQSTSGMRCSNLLCDGLPFNQPFRWLHPPFFLFFDCDDDSLLMCSLFILVLPRRPKGEPHKGSTLSAKSRRDLQPQASPRCSRLKTSQKNCSDCTEKNIENEGKSREKKENNEHNRSERKEFDYCSPTNSSATHALEEDAECREESGETLRTRVQRANALLARASSCLPRQKVA